MRPLGRNMEKLVTSRWVSPNGETVENTLENIERIKSNLRIHVESAIKLDVPRLQIWNAIFESVSPYTGEQMANTIARELLGMEG